MTDALLERNIWFTLVGHADHLGVITQVPMSLLLDYCRTSRRSTVTNELDRLIDDGRLKRLRAEHRRHYQLLGDDWRDDIPAARHFVATESARVRTLRNQRARQGQNHSIDTTIPRVRVVKLTLASNEHPLKYIFNVQIAGVGSIYDVAVIERTKDGTTYVSGPAKRMGSEWNKLVMFEASLESEINDLVLKQAQAEGLPLPRAFTPHPETEVAS